MAREKFLLSAQADLDSGMSMPNITVIQKMRQMSSTPHLASLFSASRFPPGIGTLRNKKKSQHKHKQVRAVLKTYQTFFYTGILYPGPLLQRRWQQKLRVVHGHLAQLRRNDTKQKKGSQKTEGGTVLDGPLWSPRLQRQRAYPSRQGGARNI